MRNGIAYSAQVIRDSVAMEDAANRYLPGAALRGGKMGCPFHNERTPSLRLYRDHFHCFGCGAHGDVLDFVGRVLDVKAMDAVARINADFGLGLPVDRKPKLSDLQRGSKRIRDNTLSRQREQERKDKAFDAYLDALEELIRLENNRDEYAPVNRDDLWHPLFVEALQKLEYQRYLAGELWLEI